MNELVQKLATGDHRVIYRHIGDDPVKDFKESIDRDYVHIKFTETRGGTELGFKLDPEHTDLSAADFEAGKGKAKVAGNLILDYVKVRCVAEVDLESMEGLGHLDVLEDEDGDGDSGEVN